LRINDQNPIKEVWKASMDDRAAFAPDAITLIQSLPDNGKLSIKTTRSTDRKVVLRNSELLLMAIAPINASLGDQSRDFASYLRYSTKIEFALFPQRLTRAGTKACDWADGSVDEPVGSSP
jgi:hypothetical protein